MRGKILLFVFVTGFCGCANAGEIFRCLDAHGDAMYTNMACPANSQAQHVASYNPVPDAPSPTYNVANNANDNALEAHRAAQMAYQTQAAYEQGRASAESESSDGDDYADGWIPYYGFGPGLQRHRHSRHAKLVRPLVQSPHTQAAMIPLHH